MKKIKVGVIFGGQSTEHEISVISGSSVIKNLNKEKYQICPIYISKEGNWYKYTKPVENVEIFSIGEEPKELEKIEERTKYFIKEKKQMEELYQFMNEAKQKIEIADSFKDKEDVRDAGGT